MGHPESRAAHFAVQGGVRCGFERAIHRQPPLGRQFGRVGPYNPKKYIWGHNLIRLRRRCCCPLFVTSSFPLLPLSHSHMWSLSYPPPSLFFSFKTLSIAEMDGPRKMTGFAIGSVGAEWDQSIEKRERERERESGRNQFQIQMRRQ